MTTLERILMAVSTCVWRKIFRPTQQNLRFGAAAVDKALHIHSIRCAKMAVNGLDRFLSNIDASPIQCLSSQSAMT
jgi:hypothetical protein